MKSKAPIDTPLPILNNSYAWHLVPEWCGDDTTEEDEEADGMGLDGEDAILGDVVSEEGKCHVPPELFARRDSAFPKNIMRK